MSANSTTAPDSPAMEDTTPLLRKPSLLKSSQHSLSFSRNFMIVTLTTVTLYFTSFIASFFISDVTSQIVAYTIQGCATMWCGIVWFLHHVWLVENPAKFMQPLHLSPHYSEILRFDSLLEHYSDIRNIAVAGLAASLLLSFAASFVFWLVASWYWGFAQQEIYGWFGEYEVKGGLKLEVLLSVVSSCLGWLVVVAWFLVTCQVVYALVMQMVDIWKLMRRRRAELVSQA